MGSARLRAEPSIKTEGRDLFRLTEARFSMMREVTKLQSLLCEVLEAEPPTLAVADRTPIDRLVESITSKTLPSSPHSTAARAQLIRLSAAYLGG
jgi:hypothetical protein